MVRLVQLCMGPAGSGKSTFCMALEQFLKSSDRLVTLVNLDPAAEALSYTPDVDIRDLVSLDDSTALRLGPNGGLIFCLEYLSTHIEWLHDQLNEAGPSEDEHFILDCPGQIELYTHLPALRLIIRSLKKWGFSVCGTFLIDAAMVVGDVNKYLSAVLLSTSAMISLEIPWLNFLTKVDLIDEADANLLCGDDYGWIRDHLSVSKKFRKSALTQRFSKLNEAICTMVEDISMVRFIPLNNHDPESLEGVVGHLDLITQYGEDTEPKEPHQTDYEDVDQNE